MSASTSSRLPAWYVWTDKEVHQLLEDIGEQIDAGTTQGILHRHRAGVANRAEEPLREHRRPAALDDVLPLLLCALKHLFQGEPQRQMISGLISTSYVDSDGEVRTTLKLEPRYESAGEVMAKLSESWMPSHRPCALASSLLASPASAAREPGQCLSSTLYRHLKDNYDDTAKLREVLGAI